MTGACIIRRSGIGARFSFVMLTRRRRRRFDPASTFRHRSRPPWRCAAAAFTNGVRRSLPRAQLLDEHPPQLLELHELELHELDELQLDDEQLLSDASNEPLPAFRAASDDIRDAVCTVCEYTDQAVPASAPAPNSAAVHSNGSGSSRSRSCV